MKQNIKHKFTHWYVKRGYTFGYDNEGNEFWVCPWWVRPLLTWFSPSIYYVEIYKKGIRNLTEAFDEAAKAINKLAITIKKGEINNADDSTGV